MTVTLADLLPNLPVSTVTRFPGLNDRDTVIDQIRMSAHLSKMLMADCIARQKIMHDAGDQTAEALYAQMLVDEVAYFNTIMQLLHDTYGSELNLDV